MLQAVRKTYPFTLLQSHENLGFSKGNNLAAKHATGRYLLFLNSDVIVQQVDFSELVASMDEYSHVGALTVKIELINGHIDPASHRGFPTLWRSFTYYAGFEKVLGTVPFLNKLFGGYHLCDKDLRTTHAIDSPSGAFFLTRHKLFDELGGFDEQFFMYGEDIDLAYRIKQHGYSVEYNPHYHALHLKYTSGLKQSDPTVQEKIKDHFYDAMKIFYRKHYQNKYPSFVAALIFAFIDLKKQLS